jgi:accessory gene regulator B
MTVRSGGDDLFTRAAHRLANGFLSSGVIAEDSLDIYVYGFEIIISTVVNFALTLLLAILFGRPLDAPIYLLTTFPLRTFGGGWHANTHLLCGVMHACAFTAVSWLSAVLWGYVPFAAVSAMSAAVVVIVLLEAPSEHPDNPLTDAARIKSRRRCIAHALLLAAAAMLAGILGGKRLSLLIAFSALSAAGTMLFKSKPTESE